LHQRCCHWHWYGTSTLYIAYMVHIMVVLFTFATLSCPNMSPAMLSIRTDTKAIILLAREYEVNGLLGCGAARYEPTNVQTRPSQHTCRWRLQALLLRLDGSSIIQVVAHLSC
jgi:hypothetical protein